MAFRFRRSIKLLPGVRLNVSKSGITTSIGIKGATVNVGGKDGPRATVGIRHRGSNRVRPAASGLANCCWSGWLR